MGDSTEVLGQAAKVVKKAVEYATKPFTKASEEKEKIRKFEESRLGPLSQEIETWQNIYTKLENIVMTDREVQRQDELMEINGCLKITTDSYRRRMLDMVEKYQRSGCTGTDLRREFKPYFEGIKDVIEEKKVQKETIIKDEGPSKAPYYGWKAASVGVGVAAAYAVAKIIWRK